MKQIILFYKYIQITNPQDSKAEQLSLCQSLDLRGRIILAHEGINGTLSGTSQDIAHYIEAMNNHPLFSGIDFKQSTSEHERFPRLRVLVKNEICYLGVDPEKITASQGGTHLSAQQAHELLQNKPDNLIILDARNKFESRIGAFDQAITPNIKHFRDLPQYIDENAEQFKDKQVLMYCTGGIRCERASAYLKSKNVASHVYQLEGGIHRYTEQFPNGYFLGKNYVFDGRIAVKVTDDILTTCDLCNAACDDYANCMRAACNKQFIACDPCITKYKNACSLHCYELIYQHQAPQRPMRKKIYNSCSANQSEK